MTRTLTLRGTPAATAGWATSMTELVNEATGRQVALWQSVSGLENGTFTWALQVDGIADVMSIMMPLVQREDFGAEVEAVQPMLHAPAVDTLYSPMNEMPEDGTRQGNVLGVGEFHAAPGQLGEAIGATLELAALGDELTGHRTTVLATTTGSFSRVVSLTAFRDATALDQAWRTTIADETYRKGLGAIARTAVPASGRRSVHVRTA